jgi:Protein of unknown function (DUF2844)
MPRELFGDTYRMMLTMLTRTVFGAVALLTVTAPALASLGGDVTSVEADRVRMKGALQTNYTANYTVHEIQAGKLTIHEFVSLGGQVFAVSWRGDGVPNLPQVLGSYYPKFQAAVTAAGPHYNHHQLTVNTADVVVMSSGHIHGYAGRAWVPGLLPQNFSLNEIH